MGIPADPRSQPRTCTRTSPSASTRQRPRSSRSSSCVAHISQSSPTSTGSCRKSATRLARAPRHGCWCPQMQSLYRASHRLHYADLSAGTSKAADAQDWQADTILFEPGASVNRHCGYTNCGQAQHPHLISLCQPSSYDGSIYSSANRGCRRRPFDQTPCALLQPVTMTSSAPQSLMRQATKHRASTKPVCRRHAPLPATAASPPAVHAPPPAHARPSDIERDA